jgi:hypothetical protein
MAAFLWGSSFGDMFHGQVEPKWSETDSQGLLILGCNTLSEPPIL